MSKKSNFKHEALIKLEKLYEKGDFFKVRKDGKQLAASNEISDDEKREVNFLVKASGIDPLAMLAGLFTLLFSLIVGFVLIH